jgi:hypothetical protein
LLILFGLADAAGQVGPFAGFNPPLDGGGLLLCPLRTGTGRLRER